MTEEHLIDSIKVRAFVPVSQKTFSREDILRLASDVIQTRIAPFLIKLNEGYCEREGEYFIPELSELPEVTHPILAQAVAAQLLESLGFIDKSEAAKRTLEKMEADVIPFLSPRPDGIRKRVINLNPIVRFL